MDVCIIHYEESQTYNSYAIPQVDLDSANSVLLQAFGYTF